MKLAEDLRELHAPLNDGILTEVEFEAQKAKLLAGQAPAIDEPEGAKDSVASVETAVQAAEPISATEAIEAEADVDEAPGLQPPEETAHADKPAQEAAANDSTPTPRKRWGLKLAAAGLLVAGLTVGTWMLISGSNGSALQLIEELPANSRVALAVDTSIVTDDPEFQEFFEDLMGTTAKLGRHAGPMEILLIKTVPKIQSITCAATQDRHLACHLRGDFDDARSAFMSFNEKMSETEFLGYQTWFRASRKRKGEKGKDGSVSFKQSGPSTSPNNNDSVIVDMKEEGLIIGHAAGAKHILSARRGNTQPLADNAAIDEALSQVDRSAVLLLAGEEPSDRAGGGLIRGALTYALSVSVGSTLEIQAVAIAGDDTMRKQLRRAGKRWPEAKASAETMLKDDGRDLVRTLRKATGELGDISAYLVDGAETSLDMLGKLIDSASLEETEKGFRFRAEAPIPDGSLINISIALPTMVLMFLFAVEDVRSEAVSAPVYRVVTPNMDVETEELEGPAKATSSFKK
jgi:hypothetical protein